VGASEWRVGASEWHSPIRNGVPIIECCAELREAARRAGVIRMADECPPEDKCPPENVHRDGVEDMSEDNRIVKDAAYWRERKRIQRARQRDVDG
jgi:hypothetical protein